MINDFLGGGDRVACVAEFVDNGGVLTPAMAKKFSREAVKTASEDYGFAEDAEKWRKDWMAKSESYFDDENAKQYAENEYAGVASDGTTESEENTFDDDTFIKIMGKNLIKTEEMKDFIYLDKNGHITVGVGSMLDNVGKFKSMEW